MCRARFSGFWDLVETLRSWVDNLIGFQVRCILSPVQCRWQLCDTILLCCCPLFCTHCRTGLVVQTAYIDVCDDSDYSKLVKGYHQQALAANIPAITTAGIYPGVSNSTWFSFWLRSCLEAGRGCWIWCGWHRTFLLFLNNFFFLHYLSFQCAVMAAELVRLNKDASTQSQPERIR